MKRFTIFILVTLSMATSCYGLNLAFVKHTIGVAGPPKSGLLAYYTGDSIELSTDDYASLSTFWQDVFFADSNTPRTVPFLDVIARGELNNSEVVGSKAKGVAIYADSTSQDILDRAITYFKQSDVTYIYVDSAAAGGGDGSESTPYNTLADAVTAYTDGDSILLKRGSTFREQFEIPDNSRVVPYGTGSLPIVSGAEPLTNASFSLTSGQTYTYEISVPNIPTVTDLDGLNPNDGVLMVWEDDVRLGKRSDPKSSIAEVEASPGSHWWDSATETLYIHPTASDNPTTNGKAYEASVRLHCLYNGDNFFVAGIQAEKSYASGLSAATYPVHIKGAGYMYKVKASHGFSHLIGVANDYTADTLTFDSCVAHDTEEVSFPGSTNFVAYKNNCSTSLVVFKDCLASQPNEYTTFQNGAITVHGDSVSAQIDSLAAQNMYSGLNTGLGDAVSITYSGTHVFDSCRTAVDQVRDVDLSVRAVNCKYAIKPSVDMSNLTDIWTIDCDSAVYPDASLGLSNVSGCIFAATDGTGNGLVGLNGADYNYNNNIFYDITTASDMLARTDVVLTGDNNVFYSVPKVVGGTFGVYTPPPYDFNLAQWQAASGQDLNSTIDEPTLPDGFWTMAVPDVLGDFD